jgi:hypothetical protein
MTNYLFKKGSKKADLEHFISPLDGEVGPDMAFEPLKGESKTERPFCDEKDEDKD